MRRIIRAAILVLLVNLACGVPVYQSDADLVEWVRFYENDALEHGIKVKGTAMVFTDTIPDKLSDKTIGYCQIYSNGAKVIRILRSFWNDASRATAMARYSLTLHEQGHCTFGLDHSEGGIMDASIQYPTDELVEQYWNDINQRRLK